MAENGNTIWGDLLGDALKFATPFAQKLVNQVSTPKEVQAEVLKNAALNGSGPNDPTLARQSPLGILDFLTGPLSNATSASESGLRRGGLSGGLILVVIAAIIGVMLIVRK